MAWWCQREQRLKASVDAVQSTTYTSEGELEYPIAWTCSATVCRTMGSGGISHLTDGAVALRMSWMSIRASNIASYKLKRIYFPGLFGKSFVHFWDHDITSLLFFSLPVHHWTSSLATEWTRGLSNTDTSDASHSRGGTGTWWTLPGRDTRCIHVARESCEAKEPLPLEQEVALLKLQVSQRKRHHVSYLIK